MSPQKQSLQNPEIRQRAQIEYPSLADEIEGELPDFDTIFDCVENFYRSLPW